MELIIAVIDRQHSLAFKAGDVIACMPDGHPWTKAELNNPEWRLVKCPLLQVEVDALLVSGNSNITNKMTSKRAQRVDISMVPDLSNSASLPRDEKEKLLIDKNTFKDAVKPV